MSSGPGCAGHVGLVPVPDLSSLRRALTGNEESQMPFCALPAGAAGPLPAIGDAPRALAAMPRPGGEHVLAPLRADAALGELCRRYARLRTARVAPVAGMDELSPALATRPRFFTLVAVAAELDDRVLWRFEELVWAELIRRPLDEPLAAGIITGRDVGAISRLMARTFAVEAAPGHRHVQVMPFWERWPTSVAPDDLRVLQDADGAALLRDALAESPGILSIFGHGTDDSARVGPDVICGIGNAGRPEIEAAGLPVCAHRDRCFKAGAAVVRARDLPCQVAFANICMGLKLASSIFDTAYSLALSFLDGWPAAYVSSPVNKEAWLFENLFFVQLCTEAGLPVGEAVALVNRALVAATGEPTRHHLVGDPTLRVVQGPPATPPLVVAERTGERSWRVRVPRVGALGWAEVADRELADAASRRSLFAAGVHAGDGGTAGLSWAGVPVASDRLLLLVTSSAGGGSPAFDVELTTESPLSERDHALLRGGLDRLASGHPVRIAPEKLTQGRLNQVRGLAQGLGRLLAELGHSGSAHAAARAQADRLREQLGALEEVLIQAAAERMLTVPFTSLDCYDSLRSFRTVETFEELGRARACGICGSPLVGKVVQHCLDLAIRRRLDLCYRCGIQRDAPVESQLGLRILAPEHLRLGRPMHMEVELVNAGPAATGGIMALRVGKTVAYQLGVDPAWERFELEPGATRRFPVSILMNDDLIPHAHFAKLVVLERFSLVYTSRPISVRP